jgi:hypothetical protein
MGTGLRVFILSGNSIQQISFAKLNRLQNAHPDESLPLYAGRRIKLAVVVVGTESRKPVEILHIDCTWVTIDKDGKFDQKEIQEMKADGIKCLELPLETTPSNVIDASSMFAIKKFRNKYTWTPTKKELEKIKQLIFK